MSPFHDKRTLLFLILFAFIPAWAGAVPFFSEETELALGQKADRQVVRQYGIYQDKELQLYVNRVGQKLVDNLSDKVFRRYFFKLVDSSDINAFALPGGYIYVTRGLLANLNSESELANVLGHEIGHVIFHHGTKMIVRTIGAQILSLGAAIANPQNAGQWLVVSSAMFQQINMGYGREAELESDAQGMLNSAMSGYDPSGMVHFLRNLRRQEIMSGQAYHSFQATHPDTKERIIKGDLLSNSFAKKFKTSGEDPNLYISRLKGLRFGGRRHAEDTTNYDPEYIDVYEVREGDTFQSIARDVLGDPRADLEISVLNGRKEDSIPVPGELIKVVKKGTYDKKRALTLTPEAGHHEGKPDS
jgi:predicted Zn-dependent protease